MESIRMTGQLSVLVVGQDILCTTGEVGSFLQMKFKNICDPNEMHHGNSWD